MTGGGLQNHVGPRSRLVVKLTRREVLQRAGMGAFALSLPSLLAACSSSEDGNAGTAGEVAEFNWGTTSIRALDYARSFDVQTGVPVAIALESLLTYSSDLKLEPLLAESWSQPDPLSYVFKLRGDVTFWDGSALTADDVVFSIERHRDPKLASEMGFFFSSVDSIEATSENEVTVRLKNPDPFLPYVQTFTSITPREFSEAQGDNLGAPGAEVTTMGTGPFEVTSFRADEIVTLVRNDSYWGEKPLVKDVNIRLFGDPQTMQLAMRSAEIDGTFQVPLPQADQWSQIEGTNTVFTPGLNVISIFFRLDLEPWSDIHVRRAFAHAIDREGLVQNLLGGHAEVAKTIVPPAQWGGLLSSDEVESLYEELPSYEFDIDTAREELAQSSVPEGFSAEIEYPNIIPEIGKALLNLSQNLSELNVDLNVMEVTPQKWFADLQAEKFPIGISAFAGDYPDPANYPRDVYSKGSDANRAHYDNPEVARLLMEQQSATDQAVRADAIAQILAIAEEDLPYLHLWWPDSAMAIRDDLNFRGFSALWYNQVWINHIESA